MAVTEANELWEPFLDAAMEESCDWYMIYHDVQINSLRVDQAYFALQRKGQRLSKSSKTVNSLLVWAI